VSFEGQGIEALSFDGYRTQNEIGANKCTYFEACEIRSGDGARREESEDVALVLFHRLISHHNFLTREFQSSCDDYNLSYMRSRRDRTRACGGGVRALVYPMVYKSEAKRCFYSVSIMWTRVKERDHG
jgi:hypothetical protein